MPFNSYKSQGQSLTFFLPDEKQDEVASELIVFAELSKACYVLSGYSQFIWLALEEGMGVLEISEMYQEVGGADANLVAFESELQRLHGLFTQGRLEEVIDDGYDQTITDLPDFVDLPGSYQNLSQFSLLQTRFAFDLPVDLAEVQHDLFNVINNLHVDNNNAIDFLIAVKPLSASVCRIAINGKQIQEAVKLNELLTRLIAIVRQLAKQCSDYYLAMHAAAFSVDDYCFVCPAVSGSGKTTLSASVIKQLNAEFYTDELVLLDTAANVLPLPMGLGVKAGSYAPLEPLWPELSSLTEFMRPTGIAVKYLPAPERNVDAIKSGVNCIVFPQFIDAAATSSSKPVCQVLLPGQALSRLFEAGLHFRSELSADACLWLLNWLDSTPTIAVNYCATEDAIGAIEAFLNNQLN